MGFFLTPTYYYLKVYSNLSLLSLFTTYHLVAEKAAYALLGDSNKPFFY
jgi:hypothetical protein